jgi:hypothetical protein
MGTTIFVIEASHLFRSGAKFQTQFFVMDVVNFLRRKFFDGTEDFHVIVLHGSTKKDQAERYAAALERFDVKVIRMTPIASIVGADRVFYKPTFYLHKMMGNEIPKGSHLVLIGFHNVRYGAFLAKYHTDYRLSLAAFTTPSKKLGMMGIPKEFNPYLQHSISLDEWVPDIKAEFKRSRKNCKSE